MKNDRDIVIKHADKVFSHGRVIREGMNDGMEFHLSLIKGGDGKECCDNNYLLRD